MASSAAASVASSTGPSRPNRSVKRTAPTFDAEALLDAAAVAERELRAAAAGVEDDDRAVAEPSPAAVAEVRQPRLLLAGDHLDVDARDARARRR